jgi:hypothetical protein
MSYETRRREDQATALQKSKNPASSPERSGRVSRLLEPLSFVYQLSGFSVYLSLCVLYMYALVVIIRFDGMISCGFRS